MSRTPLSEVGRSTAIGTYLSTHVSTDVLFLADFQILGSWPKTAPENSALQFQVFWITLSTTLKHFSHFACIGLCHRLGPVFVIVYLVWQFHF